MIQSIKYLFPTTTGLVAALVLLFSVTAAVPVVHAAGSGEDWEDDSKLGPVMQLLKDEDFPEAIVQLKAMLTETPDDPNIHNLLGYSYRNVDKYDESLTYYNKALEIDPKHKNAHEYLGELYLQTGKIELAEKQLEKLEDICGVFGCSQKRKLKRSIKRFKSKQN